MKERTQNHPAEGLEEPLCELLGRPGPSELLLLGLPSCAIAWLQGKEGQPQTPKCNAFFHADGDEILQAQPTGGIHVASPSFFLLLLSVISAVPLTSWDVAVVVTDAEQKELSSEERNLYKEEMLENYKNLLSLGEPKPKIYPCALLPSGLLLSASPQPTRAPDLPGLLCTESRGFWPWASGAAVFCSGLEHRRSSLELLVWKHRRSPEQRWLPASVCERQRLQARSPAYPEHSQQELETAPWW